MTYTKTARVIAGLALLLGILSLVMGFTIATGIVVEPEQGRYLGNKTTGQMIDKGTYTIIFAVALGVLTEISQSLSNIDNEEHRIYDETT